MPAKPSSLSGERDSPEPNVSLKDVLNALKLMNDRLTQMEERNNPPTPVTDSDNDEDIISKADAVTPAILTPSPVTTPVASSRPAQNRDPRVAAPETFTGKVSEYQNFIAQCTLVLTVCPNTYTTEEQRVFFVISHLKGEPLTWARDIITNPFHPLRNDYKAFTQAFANVYGDRAYKLEAEDKIQRLTQTKSASQYAQTFQALAAALELNDESKCMMFYNGLKPAIKTAIVIAGRQSPLHRLVNQAITLDQQFFQQSRQLEKRSHGATQDSEPANKRRGGDNRFPDPPSFSSTDQNPRDSRPRGPLSDEEKTRRCENGLCLYCGEPSHTADRCPNKPPKAKALKPSGVSSLFAYALPENDRSHSPAM